MSQHDFNIANQTFPSFRADLNNALVAAATMSAGSSAPTTPYAYQLWFDTTTSTWKVRNSGNTAWISTITTDLATGNLDVTGTVTADGLTVDGTAQIGSDTAKVKFYSDSTYSGIFNGASLGSNENFYMGAGSLFFYGGGSERMRIDSSGNVGIGTSSPSELLHVRNASGDAAVRIQGNTRTFNIEQNNYGLRFVDVDAGSAERMRITASGNLLVGTTDGVIWNDASGEGVVISPNAFQVARNNDICVLLNRQGSDGSIQVFAKGGTQVGRIDVTASSTSYVTSSDYRLKTDVTYDWDATSRLKQLKPARFAWIVDGDDAVPVDGFLAHEVQDVVPEAISGTKDGMRDEEYQVSAATGDIYTPATDDADEVIHSTDVERPEELAEGQQWRETTAAVMGTRSVPDYQGIDQSKLVPLLVKTIQELEARISALEAS